MAQNKTLLDYIEANGDGEVYAAIIDRASAAKAAAPKAARGPLTAEQKAARTKKSLAKALDKLNALRAAQGQDTISLEDLTAAMQG